SVNKKNTNGLCDTGASVSCISKAFFERAFPNEKPSFVFNTVQSIVGVGGTRHSVTGKVKLDVCFGSLTVSYQFLIVEDLHHSLIIGHDFMDAHNVKLDIRAKTDVCNLRTDTGYARTVRPTVVKAMSEVNIPVKIARIKDGNEVLLEPLTNLANHNVMGAKCLVKVKKGRATIRIINPTDKDVYLKGNKVLAIVSQVRLDSVCSLDDVSHKNLSSSMEEIPQLRLVQTDEKEWLEATIEYDGNEAVCSLEATPSNQNEDTKHETEDLIEMQKQCPDFKHIYEYLADQVVPENEKIRKSAQIGKEHYHILDGVLIHFMYVQKDQRNWHLILLTVLMGMRSNPNTDTSGFSPFKMLFGGEMRLPFDTSLVPREALKPEDRTIVTQLIDTLKIVHEMAKNNTELTQEESKERRRLGQTVLRKVHKHTTGLSCKLEDKWEGPYYIRQK
ncbi:hypothetical protein MAR_018310, partial [Mya arenaria]